MHMCTITRKSISTRIRDRTSLVTRHSVSSQLMVLLVLAPAALVAQLPMPGQEGGSGAGPCGGRCAREWDAVLFVGVGPHNQTDLCSLAEVCASEVWPDCDYSLPPDKVFPTCKGLKLGSRFCTKNTISQGTSRVRLPYLAAHTP